MKGMPKKVNTKNDLLNLAGVYPEKVKEYAEGLLARRMNWIYTGEVSGEGVNDATHKVLERTTTSGETRKYQFELQEDANCELVRLAFTVPEVESLVASLGG